MKAKIPSGVPIYSVIDNHRSTLESYLRSHFKDVDVLRMVSAYFSIYGFELLEAELNKIDSIRFLFGEPASVASADPGSQVTKAFEITETDLSPLNRLEQKKLARKCADWIKHQGVEVRSIKREGFLHGKMYHTENGERGIAVVGSSNFSRRGLGGGIDPNLEINLAIGDGSSKEWLDLRNWFDEVWRDENRTKDVKPEMLQALQRVGKNQSPEFVYYKTLFELFREKIDQESADPGPFAKKLEDTSIWEKLYDFQKDAAKMIIARLEQQGGCILADSVGLGKTFTALAVIKHYDIRFNAQVLVLCPKKLRENWVQYLASAQRIGNPLQEDRFRYTVLSHTDLSRSEGTVGDVDLSQFDWSGFHLLVIDESHNFRNASASQKDDQGKIIRMSRYERLLENAIANGGQTKVLMLSATPVNTSLTDLKNQIHLLTAKNEKAFHESLGIANFRYLLDGAQKKFKSWESVGSGRNKTELVEDLGVDFFNLLGQVSIARSRRQIKKFYAESMKEIGSFPTHATPENLYPNTDLEGELSYKELNDQISSFSLSIYNPTKYVISQEALEELEREKAKYRFNQVDREKFLLGMIRTNFLKRLESSAHSLSLTLNRTIEKIDEMLDKIRRFENEPTGEIEADATPDDEEDDEEFLVNKGRRPFRLKDIDTERWKTDMVRDRQTLLAALKKVERVTPARDGKLAALAQKVRDRIKNPTRDKQNRVNRKLLVFTSFKDTAEYIYKELESLAENLNIGIAMVAGDVVYAPGGGNLQTVLRSFAPEAHLVEENRNEIDLLIATDCISEGQNLQDCDTVVNYDIHWNPVRITQRFGRIDRIGSKAEIVRMINFWPTDDMELYLNLRHRVQARMVLADAAATGDENSLESAEERARMELSFRDQQLKQLKDEIGELDDLADSVVLSDFTLDYYQAQLMRYLERHRKELEKTPYGIYAVVEGEKEGVIFFLKQNSTPGKQTQRISPTSPFFLVYVQIDGTIVVSHVQPKRTLDAFDQLSAGKTEPILALCDAFDLETEKGEQMSLYKSLLEAAATDVDEHLQKAALDRVGEKGFKIPKKSELPRNVDDFELITWLVVRSRGK